MNRAFWIVGLIGLGVIIAILVREADDGHDESSPPPPRPGPVAEPGIRTENIQCPVCEGYGYTMVQGRTGPRKQVCQFCGGKRGRVLRIPPGNVRCPTCQGFGKAMSGERYIVCPRCSGRGYIKAPFQPTE